MPASPHWVARPQRWDAPFGELTDTDVDWVLDQEPFRSFDPERFPKSIPLREIVRNDCRFYECEAGDIVVRQGDYGNSAFLILRGSVRVVLENLPPEILGHDEPRRMGFWRLFAQLWRRSKVPEQLDQRDAPGDKPGSKPGDDPEQLVSRRDDGDDTRVFLQDVSAVLEGRHSVRLPRGEVFGELAALGRIPRTATIVVDEPTMLLEIRWQGLREFRNWAPEFRQYIDELYRRNALKEQLSATPMLDHLTPAQLDQVALHTHFVSYGNFAWHESFKALAAASSEQKLEEEPVICREGEYPNGLVLVRSGFIRVSYQHGDGERTTNYLGRGQVYGIDELAHNWRQPDEPVAWQHTLRAVGYVDVLLVPTRQVERYVLESMPQEKLPPLVVPRSAGPAALRDRASRRRQAEPVEPHLLETLVERRLINGASAMLIDMQRCTHCDDCVRACAVAHEGNPRFLRHGPMVGRYMVANACMHCADPVCMIGCPTGAIHRSRSGGEVMINPATCVGCSVCANSCPYNNIQMVECRAADGTTYLDRSTHNPLLKATKCDLCVHQWGGPACQRACPHDALKRIDLREPFDLAAWLKQ